MSFRQILRGLAARLLPSSRGGRLSRLGVGRKGEQLAAQHLERAGLRIVARNLRSRLGEIDLLAADGDTLVYVEVRTRTSERAGTPEESVTPQKQRQLARLAAHDLRRRSHQGPVRIDVVGVTLTTPVVIRWLENAVQVDG